MSEVLAIYTDIIMKKGGGMKQVTSAEGNGEEEYLR